eukprot:Hpha_TRINITY_DN15186_c3_g1::TRINITY_DN15186_c3_g1_i1::g.128672::m.128672
MSSWTLSSSLDRGSVLLGRCRRRRCRRLYCRSFASRADSITLPDEFCRVEQAHAGQGFDPRIYPTDLPPREWLVVKRQRRLLPRGGSREAVFEAGVGGWPDGLTRASERLTVARSIHNLFRLRQLWSARGATRRHRSFPTHDTGDIGRRGGCSARCRNTPPAHQVDSIFGRGERLLPGGVERLALILPLAYLALPLFGGLASGLLFLPFFLRRRVLRRLASFLATRTVGCVYGTHRTSTLLPRLLSARPLSANLAAVIRLAVALLGHHGLPCRPWLAVAPRLARKAAHFPLTPFSVLAQ